MHQLAERGRGPGGSHASKVVEGLLGMGLFGQMLDDY